MDDELLEESGVDDGDGVDGVLDDELSEPLEESDELVDELDVPDEVLLDEPPRLSFL